MIRTYIIEYGPYWFLFLFLIFVLIKARIISSKKMDTGFVDLFFMTLVPISKQGIKNTFQEKLKKYYKQSNKINFVFYVLFAISALIYFLMKSIV